MKITGIDEYLYTSQLNTMRKTAIDSGNVKTTDSEAAANTDFASALSSEISKYTEMSTLASVLDKSVLNSVAGTKGLMALSEELLQTGSGREVIANLAKGQLDAIVLTDNTSTDTASPIANILDSYDNAVQETTKLEDLVAKLDNLTKTVSENGGKEE